MTRPTLARSLALASAVALLAAACSSAAPGASGTPPATSPATPAPTVTPVPSTPGEPLPTVGPVEDGMATVTTRGDIETTITVPSDPDMTEFPDGDGEFDLRWKDDDLNTIFMTLTLAGGIVTDAFVSFGVPGTSLVDDDYYADFLHDGCVVQLTQLDATEVGGTFTCIGIENGAGLRTVDAAGAFSAIP